ncbi:SAM-dependent methyltransferase [Variovorax sp. OAS795]|uniref:class I SAM-dependent methyltransferase n=1 Tax=Variovorax sp. OAS795 TaxID=3034231 RepID=UPI00339AF351
MSDDMSKDPVTRIRSSPSAIDYSALYNEHPEYVARRQVGSYEQAQIDIEVRRFKLPNLMRLVPAEQKFGDVLEIGCATGELIAAVPVGEGGRKVGIDISSANVESARMRFPQVEFRCGDFRTAALSDFFDAVIMSDVLEHVPDDREFLQDAATLGQIVLVNLPLEDNWLNRRRRYGPEDVSGHLRKYSLEDGLELFERAGLEVVAYSRVWVHETPTEQARRALRYERFGAAFAGAWPMQVLRKAVFAAASAMPWFGRRLLASNLFVAARRKPLVVADQGRGS